jgi:hypothetical protein
MNPNLQVWFMHVGGACLGLIVYMDTMILVTCSKFIGTLKIVI